MRIPPLSYNHLPCIGEYSEMHLKAVTHTFERTSTWRLTTSYRYPHHDHSLC